MRVPSLGTLGVHARVQASPTASCQDVVGFKNEYSDSKEKMKYTPLYIFFRETHPFNPKEFDPDLFPGAPDGDERRERSVVGLCRIWHQGAVPADRKLGDGDGKKIAKLDGAIKKGK